MILDQSDPTGLGLFSRCARNQACKTTKTRPQTANSKKSMNSPQIHEHKRQKTINQDMFARQQSRQQRQKKYKRQHTPAVGQYNNIILKPKPKLVWDEIKVYHKKARHVKQLQQLKQKINTNNYRRGNRHYKSLDFQGMDYCLDKQQLNDNNNNNNINRVDGNNEGSHLTTYQQISTHHNNNHHHLSHSHNPTTIITQPLSSSGGVQHKNVVNQKVNNNNINKNNTRHLLTQSFSYNNKNNSNLSPTNTKRQYQHEQNQQQHQQQKHTQQQQWPMGLKKKSIINKKICMVDMSRTTGREGFLKDTIEDDNFNYNQTLGTNTNTNNTSNNKFNLQLTTKSTQQLIQINKSLQKIKPRTKPNYYFKKMLGRKDQTSKTNAGNVYDCNIDMVRPKRSALMNFGIIKGRDDNERSLKKKQYQRGGYSYTHYDFNQYVWKSTSAVFPNTKKGLIPFDKQR